MGPVFSEFFEDLVGKAPNVFLQDGHHGHFIFVGTETEVIPVLADIPSREGMEKLYKFLESKFQKDCLWYVQIVEAWFIMRSEPEIETSVMPSQSPDRREMLMVIGASKDGEQQSKSWEILRDPLRLEDTEHNPAGFHSRMDEALLGRKIDWHISVGKDGKLSKEGG